MKATIEIEFSIDGNQGFPKEDIKKAIMENLQVANPPYAHRTLQGNVVVYIEDVKVIDVYQS